MLNSLLYERGNNMIQWRYCRQTPAAGRNRQEPSSRPNPIRSPRTSAPPGALNITQIFVLCKYRILFHREHPLRARRAAGRQRSCPLWLLRLVVIPSLMPKQK